jgi:hypothetical protein
MYDLRRRDLSALTSSNKRSSWQTLHVCFLVKLRTELDVPIARICKPLRHWNLAAL